MKNIYKTTSIITLIVIFCLNYSKDSSEWDDKKPSWNCHGTLIDSENRTHDIEFITISGLYEKIPVYYEPDSPKKNPSGHTQLINLRDIKELTADPVQGKKSFMDRNYVEITATFRKGGKEKYLVEEYRELWYFLPTGPTGKAEVKFDRIRSLKIDKCSLRMHDESNGKEKNNERSSLEHAHLQHESFLQNVKHSLSHAYDTVCDSFKHLFA